MKKLRLVTPAFVMLFGMISSKSSAQDTIRVSVYFDYAKSILIPEAITRLDSLADVLTKFNVESLRITGNTDNHGSYDYNRTLSESRSRTVYDYLADKGINMDNLEILAQGKSLPLSPGSNESSRATNRRVDILAVVMPRFPAKTKSVAVSYKRGNQEIEVKSEIPQVRLKVPEGAFYPYTNTEITLNYDYRTDMDKMVKAGFTTMSSEGEVLASAGVICLKASTSNGQALADSFRLTKPVEVYLAASNCACIPGEIMLWSAVKNDDNTIVWARLKDSVKLLRETSHEFYVFNVNSLTCINLDCYQKTEPLLISFRRYEAVSVKLVYPRSKAIIVGKMVKPGIVNIPALRNKETPKIYAVAKDHNGAEYRINGKRLNSFSTNLFTGRITLRKSDFKKAPVLKIKKVNKDQVTYGFVEPK